MRLPAPRSMTPATSSGITNVARAPPGRTRRARSSRSALGETAGGGIDLQARRRRERRTGPLASLAREPRAGPAGRYRRPLRGIAHTRGIAPELPRDLGGGNRLAVQVALAEPAAALDEEPQLLLG